MAIDDVISDYENSLAQNAALSLQPASGDEWLVVHIMVVGDSWTINSHTNADNSRTGVWGGATNPAVADFSVASLHELRYLVSNSEYIRVRNGTTGTAVTGFSAIKTKD